MSVVVTGASGHLGQLVVQQLLDQGVEPGRIVAGARNPDALQAFAARGVQTRRIDYSDAGSLATGFAGAEKVLLVSGTQMGQRVTQHTAAARAAQDAGAGLLIYTSAPYADTTSLQLATEHRGTEEAIRALGVPFAFLRNGWYFENYTAQLPVYLEQGAVLGSAGAGRISGAARADFAAAAAAVLTSDGHAGAVYELGGDTSFSLSELAALVAQRSGRPVVYRDLPEEEYTTILESSGMPAPFAAVLASTDVSIAKGELLIETGDLSRLIGRPTSSLDDAVTAALD